jgi:hypothetical protein
MFGFAAAQRRTLGTAGDQGEENWATLLRNWLPSTYHVAVKGRILSGTGEASPQVDVVVLSPSYPQYLLDKKLFLAGGVLAAFECKTTLRAAHIKEAVANAAAIRRQLPTRHGTPYRELQSPLFYGLLAHSHDWRSDRNEVSDRILDLYKAGDLEVTKHPREMLDLICVADLGVWSLWKIPWMGPYTTNRDHPNRVELWQQQLAPRFGAEGCALTSFTKAIIPPDGAPIDPKFTPIGAMLSILLKRLAWEDRNLRDVASYFRDVNMEGGGAGYARTWDKSVFSEAVQPDVMSGAKTPGMVGLIGDPNEWNEWAGLL